MQRPITTRNRAISVVSSPRKTVIGATLHWIACNKDAYWRTQSQITSKGVHF